MKSVIGYVLILCGSIAWNGVSYAESPPRRVVAAGGDLTEIVYALNAGDRLVGVDSTSRYPAEATKKEQIGYVRRVSPEGVLSLKPDIIIGANDMGPPAALDQLRATGVAVVLAPEGDTPEGIQEKIRFVGKHLGLVAEAEVLAKRTSDALAAAVAKAAETSKGRKVLFVLSVGDSGVLVGGQDTAADEIIRLAGGVNAAQGFAGYKTMSRESILQAGPEVVLMMAGRAEGHGGAAGILDRPEFKLTPAARGLGVVEMDGLLLLGFGPRTPSAVAELSNAINR